MGGEGRLSLPLVGKAKGVDADRRRHDEARPGGVPTWPITPVLRIREARYVAVLSE
jgi:hypothetical protein